ncbi:MAG TPA: phosphotransferase, partial [Nitrospira sp.]|nr:phosphotransferase [Nitrospira sp.]
MLIVHETDRVSPGAETVVCRPVILRHDDTEALFVVRDGKYSVPLIEVSRWQRIAPHLVSQLRTVWNLEAICRFSLAAEEADNGARFVVLDAIDSSAPAPGGTAWASVHDLMWERSEALAMHGGLNRALQQAKEYRFAEPPIPFTRPDWFKDVTVWVRCQLAPLGLRLTGGWTQYNMGPAFELIRYETEKQPVWFKAVGEPNLQEFAIQMKLAKLCSSHIPEVLATHSGWHGWLMRDANARPLDEIGDIEGWKTAARSLAELQIQTIPKCEALLRAGCDDLRVRPLRLQVGPFIDTIAQLMQLQPITPPPILSRDNLCLIEVHLQRAIDEVEMLGIPNTIGHSDLNPGNVLVNNDGAVFLDWMQGHIGHPVVTFEYL